jgi:tRNA dimethylallyltransferase
MLESGALDEVKALAQRRLDPALPAMKAHGVPWLIRHLNGEIARAEGRRRREARYRAATPSGRRLGSAINCRIFIWVTPAAGAGVRSGPRLGADFNGGRRAAARGTKLIEP